jgi:hypothetical protein
MMQLDDRSTNHDTTRFGGNTVACPPHVTVNFQSATLRTRSQFISAHVYLDADLSLTQPAPPADTANGVDGQNPQFFAAMPVVREGRIFAEPHLNNPEQIPPAAGNIWTLV